MAVNGTEDVALGWDAINGRLPEDNVGRLRCRIFQAAREQDLAKVRSLQKMMLRSWSNTLVSVRQVTQRNAGRKTAGIDGEIALSSPARMALAVRVHSSARTWNPLPVKRVYVPKANAKLRPLGIPVIMDRCHQNRAKNALEPEWEARFEARSYGFRPGRSCQDAIEAIYDTCKGRTAARIWALDADLAAAFDRLDHSHLMPAIGSFPGREMIRAWLTAGVFEPGKGFAPTEEGSPQGSPITPPTQLATSASKSRWVTGGWSVAGDGRAGAGWAGRGGAAGVCARGGAGRDLGGRAGRDRAGRLGPAGRGLAGRAGCLHGADHRVVDRAVTGSGAGPVLIDWAGAPATSLDISGSIFMACLGGWIACSTPSGSTRLLIWWGRVCLRRRPHAALLGGSGARSARPAGMWTRPPRVARWRCPSRAWCSPSSCRGGWLRRSASMPGSRGAPSPRWWPRPWRSSWSGVTGTIPAGERPGSRDGVRLRPACGHRCVGGLRDIGAAAAGPPGAGWPGRTAAR